MAAEKPAKGEPALMNHAPSPKVNEAMAPRDASISSYE
jgi:hypothetical protein